MGMLHRHKMRLREEAEKQAVEVVVPPSEAKEVAEGQDVTAKPKRTRKTKAK